MFPAHAGVILQFLFCNIVDVNVPRTRGGDPKTFMLFLNLFECSPHTRG